MELRHFRYFIGVAEELSFLRASRRLNVSQPPLTQAIKDLEEELGVCLLERTSRRVELTEAGSAFLSRARSILAQINRTTIDLRSQAQSKKEILRVGFTRTMSILPEAMKGFRKSYPDVHLQLMPAVGRSARDYLLDDEVDLSIGEYLLPDSRIDSRLWAEAQLVAVVPQAHPLARRKQIRIRELRDEPLLLPGLVNAIYMGREVLQFCREAGGFEPQFQHCDDMEVLLSLVESEAGIGILHGFYLNKETRAPDGGTRAFLRQSIPFYEQSPLLKIGVVWRRDRVTPAMKGLVNELESRVRVITRTKTLGIIYSRNSLAAKA